MTSPGYTLNFVSQLYGKWIPQFMMEHTE